MPIFHRGDVGSVVAAMHWHAARAKGMDDGHVQCLLHSSVSPALPTRLRP